jgi:hypothetical protein
LEYRCFSSKPAWRMRRHPMLARSRSALIVVRRETGVLAVPSDSVAQVAQSSSGGSGSKGAP